MLPTIVFLIKAGSIKEDDDLLPVIQGLSVSQAEAIADWLVLATGDSVVVRCITAGIGVCDIRRDVDDVKVCRIGDDKSS